jgi:outer membrane protein TolC
MLVEARKCFRVVVVGLSLLRAGATAASPPPSPAAVSGGLALIEAVELALAHDPNIALAESLVDASRGSRLVASGLFDPVVTSGLTSSTTDLPTAPGESEEASVVSGSLGLATLLRNGLVLAPEVQLGRTTNGSPAVNTATLAFNLRQPLLRGRGRAAVTAAERAADRELAASGLDLRHTVSLRLLAVISQYWATRAAAEDLEVLRQTEASSRDLLATTRRLIEADVTPAAEIVQLEADLVAQETSRIAGEQALFAARQDLGREIGLEPWQIRSLPLPSSAFPEVEPGAVPREAVEEYGRRALARRADLAAAQERLEASEAFLAAAENALLPSLDLLLTPSYTGLVEGGGAGDFFSPLTTNVPGLSTQLGFSLSWPTRSREARGALIQSGAAVRQSALVAERTAKQIGADVPTALDAVWRAAERLERSVVAVGLFERTVENEEKKLRAGSSTLIDVINQRDRLTAARRSRVTAQLALALALAELRFQTGTMISGENDAGTVSAADLTTLPPLEAP